MRVTTISPSLVRNDADAALTLKGIGFTQDMTLAIGGKVLTNVTVVSSTELAATLPKGLCPGLYAVTMMDSAGRTLPGGGQVVVEGVRTATLGNWAATRPAIGFARQAQSITLELPAIEIVDTTCNRTDWNLTLTLGAFSPFEDGHGALPLRTLRSDGTAGTQQGTGQLTVKDGGTTGTLHVPHTAGQTSASIRPLIGVDVPSHGYAGQYRMSVAVSIEGDTQKEGMRQPRTQR
jgi:hypothetical protein